MKNIKQVYTIILSLIVLISTESCLGQNNLKGSKNVISKTVQSQDYGEIKVIGSLSAELIEGTEGEIEIIAEDNLIDFVEVVLSGTILTVGLKDDHPSYSTTNGIKVVIPFKDLESVSLNGSGEIIGKSVINSEEFKAQLTGSGEIELTVAATTVDANLNGSGDLKLNGTTSNLKAKLTGSGNLNTAELNSESTDAFLSGSGDVKVNAQKRIQARVNGSGSIKYSGNPEEKDVKILGSGEIEEF